MRNSDKTTDGHLNRLSAFLREQLARMSRPARTPEGISPLNRSREDLGIDSLYEIELIMAVEEEFGIRIPEETLEVLGASYTVADLEIYLTERLEENRIGLRFGVPGDLLVEPPVAPTEPVSWGVQMIRLFVALQASEQDIVRAQEFGEPKYGGKPAEPRYTREQARFRFADAMLRELGPTEALRSYLETEGKRFFPFPAVSGPTLKTEDIVTH